MLCGLKEASCAANVLLTMKRKNGDILKSCNCLPECNSIKYDYSILREPFYPENISEIESVASVSIYFADNEFSAYKRFESYGTVQLLSNIGGFLGLFLGISVLSLVEFFYFFTLRFIDDFWYIPDN